MWTLALQVVSIGLCLQVTTCYGCSVTRRIADCTAQRHRVVPVLPADILHLYLDLNHIREIDNASLRSYEQLQHIDLGRQNVPLVIRNDAFLAQKNLTHLVLGFNRGLRLEPRAFQGLFNLQQLFLDHCDLNDSILAENYLQPLVSLESLDLFGNQIVRLRPGLFFSNLTKFTELNLKLNRIETLCEEDLVGFHWKFFMHLNLNSNRLYRRTKFDCGNPFRTMTFNVLDLNSNGLNYSSLCLFFKAIEGTTIGHLKISGHGKGFSFANFPDPDEKTFEGLGSSSVYILDLSGDRIFALQRAVFRPLKVVMIIDVSNNDINQIHTNAFIGLQGNLKMLNLSSNLLGEIRSSTFTHLTELLVLDLSYNHIGALGYAAFRGLPKLETLDLTGNSLRDLGFPAALPSLRSLVLGDNKLKSLNSLSVLGETSVYVNVADNRLTNLEDVYVVLSRFAHLRFFQYGGNFIKYCSPTVSVPRNHSLQVLDLHDSSLHTVWMQGRCLDLFDHLGNLIKLNLTSNSLGNLPPAIFSGLVSVQELDLSFNALTYLQTDVFPASLRVLHLDGNFLASLDPAAFQSLDFLSLALNRFHCDCRLEPFLSWMNTSTVISKDEEHRCEFPAEVHGLPLLEFLTTVEPCGEDDEKAAEYIRFVLFVFSTVLNAAVIVGGVVYARLRGRIFIIYKKVVGRVLEGPGPAPPADEAQYDAFLCFSNSDYRWVEAALLKKLDNQFSEENIFSCCFEARDFLPGEDHLSNIKDAVWGSRKTVCVVSNNFLKDGWCLEAFTLAQGRMLEELTNVLIMLVVGKVAHYQLMKFNAVRAFVQKREYLTWPEDPQDLEWFYERLVSKMLTDTKVKKLAEDKHVDEPPQNENGIELRDIRAVVM